MQVRFRQDEPSLLLRRVVPEVLVGRRCLPVPGPAEVADLGEYVDFLPDAARTTFAAQYVREQDGRFEYCLNYLVRGL